MDNADHPEPEMDTKVVPLTFLHISGTRKLMTFDPESKIGRVKELLWGGWPTEFPSADKPPTPLYFRFLHLGRILQDEDTLLSLKFPTYTPVYEEGVSTAPPLTIIHLSIRPHGPGIPPLSTESESAKKRKSLRRSLFASVSLPFTNTGPPTTEDASESTSPTTTSPTTTTEPTGQPAVAEVSPSTLPTTATTTTATTPADTATTTAPAITTSALTQPTAPPPAPAPAAAPVPTATAGPADPTPTNGEAGDEGEHGRNRGGACCVIC